MAAESPGGAAQFPFEQSTGPRLLHSVDAAKLKWSDDGLIPAIVQDASNGQVLMMAWMNAETLAMSLREGRTVFWSRSRSEIWRKGDTSGDRQFIKASFFDCDGDTLLFVVDQEGRGACHTGERSCFFRAFESADEPADEPADDRHGASR